MSWDEFYGALISFKEREKHCRVPQAYNKDGLNLGLWVNRQRSTRDKLSPERIKRLEELGFVWDARIAL
ncbi:MAG: helicase associated domain-containing protein [Alphaproteobacteria bacterium]|nr:helicase associated domain-containing protein [Alphaproteobacteria bacterium]